MNTEEIEQIIADYEKRYKNIRKGTRVWNIIIILLCMGMIYVVVESGMVYNPIGIAFLFLVCFLISVFRMAKIISCYSKNINQTVEIPNAKDDLEGAYAISIRLLNYPEHKKDRCYAINLHLINCFSTERYEEMSQVYRKYHASLFSPYIIQTLSFNLVQYAVIDKDLVVYEQAFQERKPFRIKYQEGMKEQRQRMYNLEMLVQARHAYIHNKFDSALELLEHCTPTCTQDSIGFYSQKGKVYQKLLRYDDAQACFDHVKQESCNYALVRKTIAGEQTDYCEVPSSYIDFLHQFLQDIKAYRPTLKKLTRRAYIGLGILLTAFIFLSYVNGRTSSTFTTIENAIVQELGHEVKDVYLSFDEGNHHVGLALVKITNDESEEAKLTLPVYYMCEVQTKNNGVMNVSLKHGQFAFETNQVLTAPMRNNDHTYVIIEGNISNITYDKKHITNIKQEVVNGFFSSKLQQVLTGFIVQDEAFDLSKLNYDSNDDMS